MSGRAGIGVWRIERGCNGAGLDCWVAENEPFRAVASGRSMDADVCCCTDASELAFLSGGALGTSDLEDEDISGVLSLELLGFAIVCRMVS